MRRNGYLCTFGVNLDTTVRFADPDFLLECKICDLATFSIDYCILYSECAPYFYWPRKYTTHIDPHVDNSHQVWSCYVHTLPSYSVFVCWYVTWPCDLDPWPLDLEQLQCMAGHVTNLATKFEDPMPIRSWFMRYNVSHWLPLKMRTRPLRMCPITWPVSRGWKMITFLESPTPICLFNMQRRWLYDESN